MLRILNKDMFIDLSWVKYLKKLLVFFITCLFSKESKRKKAWIWVSEAVGRI